MGINTSTSSTATVTDDDSVKMGDAVIEGVPAPSPSPKKEEEVVSKIKNKARRSCGTIYMEFPLTDDENTAPNSEVKTSATEISPDNKSIKAKIVKENEISRETPVKRPRGRPRLTEEERAAKGKSKPKPKKRNRSESGEISSESEADMSVHVKKMGPKKYSRDPVKRSSSSGTPKKIRARIDSEEEDFLGISELLQRQSISPIEVKKNIAKPRKSSPSPKKKMEPKKIAMKQKQVPHPVILTPPQAGLQIQFLVLPAALSFTDKYFIGHRRPFLIRNYFKVRSYVKKLSKTTIRKLKSKEVGPALKSRARLESVIGKLNKTITAYFRVAVQPDSLDDAQLSHVIECGLFLRRNYVKVRENCSIATMDLTKKPNTMKKGNEGKGKALVAEFFRDGSSGFHVKGRHDNPLILTLQ